MTTDGNFNTVVTVELTELKIKGSMAGEWVQLEIDGKIATCPTANLIHALIAIQPHATGPMARPSQSEFQIA